MQKFLNKVVQDFPEIKLYIVPQIYSDQLSKTDATDCPYLNELFSRMKYQVPFSGPERMWFQIAMTLNIFQKFRKDLIKIL